MHQHFTDEMVQLDFLACWAFLPISFHSHLALGQPTAFAFIVPFLMAALVAWKFVLLVAFGLPRKNQLETSHWMNYCLAVSNRTLRGLSLARICAARPIWQLYALESMTAADEHFSVISWAFVALIDQDWAAKIQSPRSYTLNWSGCQRALALRLLLPHCQRNVVVAVDLADPSASWAL